MISTSDRTSRVTPSVLILENGSEYGLDYELMLNGFGYHVSFARTPVAAGLALHEEGHFLAVLLDADTLDPAYCISMLQQFGTIPVLVAAAPTTEIPAMVSAAAHVFRKPVIPREVERTLTALRKR